MCSRICKFIDNRSILHLFEKPSPLDDAATVKDIDDMLR